MRNFIFFYQCDSGNINQNGHYGKKEQNNMPSMPSLCDELAKVTDFTSGQIFISNWKEVTIEDYYSFLGLPTKNND